MDAACNADAAPGQREILAQARRSSRCRTRPIKEKAASNDAARKKQRKAGMAAPAQ